MRNLPARQQYLGRIFGTAGAVALRLVFIFVMTALLRVPYLQLVGGVLLLWIAWRLVGPMASGPAHVQQAGTLRAAVWTIVVADAVMSLDNVLAVAAAAHSHFLLALFGVALSLPIVVWGSGIVGRMMERWRWMIWVGGGVLGYVAGEMIVGDPMVERVLDGAVVWEYGVPLVLGIVMILIGWLRREPVTGARPPGASTREASAAAPSPPRPGTAPPPAPRTPSATPRSRPGGE